MDWRTVLLGPIYKHLVARFRRGELSAGDFLAAIRTMGLKAGIFFGLFTFLIMSVTAPIASHGRISFSQAVSYYAVACPIGGAVFGIVMYGWSLWLTKRIIAASTDPAFSEGVNAFIGMAAASITIIALTLLRIDLAAFLRFMKSPGEKTWVPIIEPIFQLGLLGLAIGGVAAFSLRDWARKLLQAASLVILVYAGLFEGFHLHDLGLRKGVEDLLSSGNRYFLFSAVAFPVAILCAFFPRKVRQQFKR